MTIKKSASAVVLQSDSVGVLSQKNTASKYWGVSKMKNKVDWMVRFVERNNKTTVNFKSKVKLTENAAAQIAAKFYNDPSLYVTSTSVDIQTEIGLLSVNTCTNTITAAPIPVAKAVVVDDRPLFKGSTLQKPSIKESKPKKVVDSFRALVDQIKRDALARAKAFLSSKDYV